MRDIIPVTDLQRQAAEILKKVNASGEPVFITQRGRASGVILSATRYAEIEDYLQAFDDDELENLIAEGERDIAADNTLTQDEVKRRLNFPE